MTAPPVAPGVMPSGCIMETVDEALAHASPSTVFDVVRQVEMWPSWLPHYRFVRYRERQPNGNGLVEMSANRPFGVFDWPTWWLSRMEVDESRPAIRFAHVGGVTRGMDVEWSFSRTDNAGTHVRLVHAWDGPDWPLVGRMAARRVIGPVFIHGIASRTLAGLTRVAEQRHTEREEAP